jgi:hypothetical protein
VNDASDQFNTGTTSGMMIESMQQHPRNKEALILPTSPIVTPSGAATATK